MIASVVREKLSEGAPVFSAKACYADPEIVEMIGQAGFDCMWLCLEHRKLDPSVVRSLIQAARIGGCDSLIRVKPENHADLSYLLESGARGIMLPQVRDLEEVQCVVEMMKFPPLGRRGFDTIHADADCGSARLEEYTRHENENTFLVVQIETPEVLPHIDAIAATPGVDMLFVGLGDLSASMNLLGQMDHPDLQAVVERVGEACLKHGKAGAIICADPEERKRLWKLGYRFFNIASDFRFLRKGFDEAIALASDLRD
jgi:4-hydroxy-2-oxoheptanedioate aldolase